MIMSIKKNPIIINIIKYLFFYLFNLIFGLNEILFNKITIKNDYD